MRVEERTIKVTKFVSEDGKSFDNKDDCVLHELRNRVEPLVNEHFRRSFGSIGEMPDYFINAVVVDTIMKMEDGVAYSNSEILEKIKLCFFEEISQLLRK